MKKYSKLMAILLVVAMILPGMGQVAQAAQVAEDSLTVTRIEGKTRVITSIEASKVAFEDGAKNVVLAGYNGEVDALAGTLLAKAKNAPLLLTRKSELEATKAELVRLGAENIYVLGGSKAVSDEIVKELKKDYEVERIAGSNREGTAVAVAEEVKGQTKHVFLAKGYVDLADALAIGPVSAIKDMPILLTNKNKVDKVTLDAIKDLGVEKVTIVGGTGAITDVVKDQLGDVAVDRVSGIDRFKTALEIAGKYFENPENAVVASSRKFADALVGGYLGAMKNAPILLTNVNNIDASTLAYLEDGINHAYILGGTGVVSDTVETKVKEAVEVEDEVALEEAKEAKLAEIEAFELEIEGMTADSVEAAEAKLAELKTAAKEAVEALETVEEVEAYEFDATEAEGLLVEKLVVESVSAINATTVDITLAEELAEDEDLTDKTITLSAEEAELTAAFKSIDGKVARFELAGDDKLVDAVEYTVSSDWAADTTFVAKVADEFVAEFVKVTEEVPASTKTEDEEVVNPTNIAVAAQDQYGEEYAISNATVGVTGVLNGMPLTEDEITYANGVVTVKNELKEDDVLEFTLTNTKDKKELAKTEFTYEVIKGEKAVVKSIVLKADETSVPSGDKIKFTADVRDQYNSPMKNENLRWVVNAKVQTSKTAQTFTLDETEPGEYKVQAFSTTDSKVSAEKTVTVGAALLKTLEVKSLTETEKEDVKSSSFNNETYVVGKIEPNEGAALVAGEIKFHVTTTDKDLTKEDIKVTAEKVTVGKGEDAKEIILVKAVTSKAGTYKVTPYVGDEFTEKETIKAGEQTVTTTVNQEVAKIVIDDLGDQVLTKDGDVTTEVTYTNKHGEVVIPGEHVEVVSNKNLIEAKAVTKNLKDEDGKDTKEEFVELTIKGKKDKGTATVHLINGDIESNRIEVELNKASEATKLEADEDMVVVEAADAKLYKVKVTDQYGNVLKEVPADLDLKEVVKDEETAILEEITLKPYYLDEDGEVVATGDKAAGLAVKLELKANDDIKTGDKIMIKATMPGEKAGDDPVEIGTLTVELREAAELAKFEVEKSEVNLTVGGKSVVKVTPLDQYGEFIDLKENLDLTKDAVVEDSETSLERATDQEKPDNDLDYYNLTLVASKAGKGKVSKEITVGEETVKFEINVNVSSALDIDKVEITNKDEIAAGKHLLNEEVVIESQATTIDGTVVDGAKVDFSKVEAKAYDANDKLVKDATVNVSDVEGGKVKVTSVTGDSANEVAYVLVTVKASANAEADTVKIRYENEEQKVDKLVVVEDKKEIDSPYTAEVVLNEEGVPTVEDVEFKAYDSRGKEVKGLGFVIADNVTWSKTTVGNPIDGVSTESTESNKLKITVKQDDLANATDGIVQVLKGDAKFRINVKLSDEVKAYYAKKVLDQAKEDAITALNKYVNAEDYIINAEELTTAITNGKAAIDAAETTEAVATALADAKAEIDKIDNDDAMYSIEANDTLSIGDQIVINAKGAEDLRIMVWANKDIADAAGAKETYYNKVTSARFTALGNVVDGDTFVKDGDKFTVTITEDLLAAIKAMGEEDGTVTNSPDPDKAVNIDEVNSLTFMFTPETSDGFFNEFETWDGLKVNDSLKTFTISN